MCCWLLACLLNQQHASVSLGRICSDNFTCCHTETKVADQTFHLTQCQYTDTGPTSPSADPKRQECQFLSHWYDSPGSSALEAESFTTRPTRRCTESEVLDQFSLFSQSQQIDTGASQSQHSPYKARRLAGLLREYQFLSHWNDSTG